MRPHCLNGAASAVLAFAVFLAGCGLPRSGPTKDELMASSVEQGGSAYVVAVDDRVARAATLPNGLGFPGGFIGAGVVGSDTIRPGDVLTIAIWENVDRGVLASAEGGATTLSGVQVDGAGFIFVPFAGRLKAAGNSPEGLRRIIAARLNEQTPDPQVMVAREAGDGATVSVIGKVGGQGNFPLERPTRTLSAMLAQAGGVTIEPEITIVTVLRGGHRGSIWLPDLYRSPGNDIALRPGDRILVEEDSRAYIALGATGGQTRMRFETDRLTAMDALAEVGGLSAATADPTGIFVLREEPAAVANRVLGRTDLSGEQRLVYVIDLTKPMGVFHAREFLIRDEDTIYVTEAPFVRWQKIIGAITGTANSATSLANVADGNS